MSPARLTVSLAAAAGFAVLAACQELGVSGNTCESTGGVPITVSDANLFDPDTVQVQETQKVCWQNPGTVEHTITTILPQLDTIDFTIPPDFTFTRAFGTPRDVRYYCRFHFEEGLIQVR